MTQTIDGLWLGESLIEFLIKQETSRQCGQAIEAIITPYSERLASRFHFYSINAGLQSSCEVVLGALALKNTHLSEQDIAKINALLLWDKEYRRDYESAHLNYKINDPNSYTSRSSLDKMEQIKTNFLTAVNNLLNPSGTNNKENPNVQCEP